MSSPTIDLGTLPDPRRRATQRRPAHRFFVAIGIVFVVVAAMGFGPHMREFIIGKRQIAPIVHFHGALMTAWLLAFLAQGMLAANGRLDLHRRFGIIVAGLGAAVFAMMIGLTVRGFLDRQYPLEENIYYSLPQLYVIAVFGPLLAAAVLLRGKPPWHKRFMVVATIVLLQAAVDRFAWLPGEGPGYWPQVICLDVLLVMLAAFDFYTLKKIHPATVAGGGFMLAGQSAVALLWPSDWWHQSAHQIAQTLSHML